MVRRGIHRWNQDGRVTVTAGALVVALLVMGAGLPAKTVPPEQYAAGVCTAVVGWQAAILGQGAAAADVQMPRKPRLADARRALVAQLDDLSTLSGRATHKLRALGAPAVVHGRELARGFVRIFARVHVDTERLGDRAEDATSTRQLTSVRRDLTRTLVRWGEGAERLQRFDPDRRLDQAAGATRACDRRPLEGAPGQADTAGRASQEDSR